MKMIPFRCAECGEYVMERISRKDVTWNGEAVPDSVLIPTCSGCGEYYVSGKLVDRIEEAINEKKAGVKQKPFDGFMHPSVREAKAIEGSQRLALVFSDGSSGIADMSSVIKSSSFFGPLAASGEFEKASVVLGAVEWGSGIGIATEALYALAHGLQHPESLREAQENVEIVQARMKEASK